jgi:hypothetical protein
MIWRLRHSAIHFTSHILQSVKFNLADNLVRRPISGAVMVKHRANGDPLRKSAARLSRPIYNDTV